MSIVYVGLPVFHHIRRFHFDKGRRWNVVEHLVLQALASGARTAGQLAVEGELPRRVILEILIRLMRAGWVELRADKKEITFHATKRGSSVAYEDQLPAILERKARKLNFAVDMLTSSVFGRRDITLVRYEDWVSRTDGVSSITINKPEILPFDLGHVATLGSLFREDEQLVRFDPSDRPPPERLALFSVRDGALEYLPPGAPPYLREVIEGAAKQVRAGVSASSPARANFTSRPVSSARPERRTNIRQDDLIKGGEAHAKHLKSMIRRTKRHLVLHSTFLDQNKFECLLADFTYAASQGARIDILWGQTPKQAETVPSLKEAEAIEGRIRATGLSGCIFIHRYSTKSHAKLIAGDDGQGGFTATVGSCNWLYSGFDSYEVSIRLRDPHLTADVLLEIAELARPPDGEVPDLSARLVQTARELLCKPALAGETRAKVVIGQEHDDCMLEARDHAKSKIVVFSHRLGVTAKPSVIIPAAAAARHRNVDVELIYGRASGPVSTKDALDAGWEFKEDGVRLVAIHRPRVHAKLLLWDDDNVVVTSLNWLSADASSSSPRQEMGVRLTGPRLAAALKEDFNLKRQFSF